MSLDQPGNINKCPCCGTLAAVYAVPCCKHPKCSWNRCKCGVTYDRVTGCSFVTAQKLRDAT